MHQSLIVLGLVVPDAKVVTLLQWDPCFLASPVSVKGPRWMVLIASAGCQWVYLGVWGALLACPVLVIQMTRVDGG